MIHYVSNHMSDRLKKEKTSVPAVQPWQKLANAIVEQAVEDYRKAQARIKANPMIADHAKVELSQLEQFFRSQWFEALTDVDGQLILSRLKKEVS